MTIKFPSTEVPLKSVGIKKRGLVFSLSKFFLKFLVWICVYGFIAFLSCLATIHLFIFKGQLIWGEEPQFSKPPLHLTEGNIHQGIEEKKIFLAETPLLNILLPRKDPYTSHWTQNSFNFQIQGSQENPRLFNLSVGPAGLPNNYHRIPHFLKFGEFSLKTLLSLKETLLDPRKLFFLKFFGDRHELFGDRKRWKTSHGKNFEALFASKRIKNLEFLEMIIFHSSGKCYNLKMTGEIQFLEGLPLETLETIVKTLKLS